MSTVSYKILIADASVTERWRRCLWTTPYCSLLRSDSTRRRNYKTIQ